MTNPTSNYSFQMPTATDLVTDLPADFEVFGQAVDTRLKALQPGTTLGDLAYSSATANTNVRLAVGTNGQVLTVTGGVPTWATGSPGDIEGVTAGIGISGGGTSGTVTVTNSMATAIDAKGDLIAGTGADAFSRLGVGANDTVLIADSGQATGLKWASPPAAAFVGVALTNSSTFSIADSTATTLTFDTENYDTDGFHSIVTNTDRITIPAGKAGKYLVTIQSAFATNTTGYRFAEIQLNGVRRALSQIDPTTGATTAQSIVAVCNASVADYFTFRVFQTSGGNLVQSGSSLECAFTATYLGA